MRLLTGIVLYLLVATTITASAQAPHRATSIIPNDRLMIALTFDDGPQEAHTQTILDILDKHDVKATFFQIGKNIKRHPEISKLVASKGHEIGNHSMSHAQLSKLAPREEIEAEIGDFQAVVKDVTGTAPAVFRAPYLKFDDRVWAVLDELGLPAYNASVFADYQGDDDTTDPAVASAHAAEVAGKIKSGSIILMHERAYTPDYLGEVISLLKKDGYTFVTLSELEEARE